MSNAKQYSCVKCQFLQVKTFLDNRRKKIFLKFSSKMEQQSVMGETGKNKDYKNLLKQWSSYFDLTRNCFGPYKYKVGTQSILRRKTIKLYKKKKSLMPR